MSAISRLFSGWNGGQSIVKNGKFSTTKNNHNRDKYGRPTVIHGYSHKYLKIWFGKDYKTVMKKLEIYKYPYDYITSAFITSINTNLPSYMNPSYHRAYHQSKHRR